MNNIDIHTLKEWLKKEQLFLLDVREQWEFDNCNIKGSINIPLHALQSNIDAISKNNKIVLICHHGARSFTAGLMLQQTGIDSELYNLEGGIDAWAEHIDNTIPRY